MSMYLVLIKILAGLISIPQFGHHIRLTANSDSIWVVLHSSKAIVSISLPHPPKLPSRS
jgi:hypothetical protein